MWGQHGRRKDMRGGQEPGNEKGQGEKPGAGGLWGEVGCGERWAAEGRWTLERKWEVGEDMGGREKVAAGGPPKWQLAMGSEA